MDSENVYVVIVTYNATKWINDCLGSLERSITDLNIIVIDNASTDETATIIQQNYKKVDLIQSSRNLGFGMANNVGIEKAISLGATYIVLLNQDAWIEPDTISGLIAIQKLRPEFGLLSAMHVNKDFTSLDYNFSLYVSPAACPDLVSDLYFRRSGIVYPANFINAAFWLLTAESIKVVGLFDPLFFHYGEDRNFCQRLQFHGIQIGVCPGYMIVHDRDNRKGVAKGFLGQVARRRKLLVLLCDVNVKNPGHAFYKALIKVVIKFIVSLILLDKNRLCAAFSDISFLLDNKSGIKRSVERNSKKWREIQA